MPSGINFEQYVKDSAAQRKNYMKGSWSLRST